MVEWLHATFALTAADVRCSSKTIEYAVLRDTQSAEILDILFQVLERESREPVGLDAATQAKYEAARERVQSARRDAQSRIKPAAR